MPSLQALWTLSELEELGSHSHGASGVSHVSLQDPCALVMWETNGKLWHTSLPGKSGRTEGKKPGFPGSSSLPSSVLSLLNPSYIFSNSI